jgi:DNA mismatch endonuclease (patch repair protein)
MRGNRRADTKPERVLRSLLHGRGYRFRKDLRVQTSAVCVRPDIAFTRARVAVFVDGCFWHHCPEHGNSPRANVGYWSEKLKRNIERDATVTAALTDAGWTVIRVWEHDDPAAAADRIALAIADLELASTLSI